MKLPSRERDVGRAIARLNSFCLPSILLFMFVIIFMWCIVFFGVLFSKSSSCARATGVCDTIPDSPIRMGIHGTVNRCERDRGGKGAEMHLPA